MDREAETRMGVAELNGVSVAFEVAGAGHPLVLLHAGIADRRMWDDQVSVFAQAYRVIRYDMRGYGETPMAPGSFAHRRDLHALLSYLGVERAYLVGCSMGGSTAIDFTLEHPAMVAALITVCSTPSGFSFEGEPPRQLAAVGAALEAGNLAEASELEVQIWVDGRQRTPEQVDRRVRDRVREMNLKALAWEVAPLGQLEPLDPPAVGRLAEITVPMLAVVGDLDEPYVLLGADQMVSAIAGAKRAVISGTAHLPNMERPDEFNHVVLEFLRELPSSRNG